MLGDLPMKFHTNAFSEWSDRGNVSFYNECLKVYDHSFNRSINLRQNSLSSDSSGQSGTPSQSIVIGMQWTESSQWKWFGGQLIPLWPEVENYKSERESLESNKTGPRLDLKQRKFSKTFQYRAFAMQVKYFTMELLYADKLCGFPCTSLISNQIHLSKFSFIYTNITCSSFPHK